MKTVFKSFKGQLIFGLIVILSLLVIPLSPALAQDSQPKIKVMTRNLYLGADIFKVVEAAQENPDDLL
ncbi:MAG TPA: hypothetical protein VKN73_09100, partial [Desulfosalsimonadaceae bacterium]|nr:hypothetical protein [Desulfosalsimonadaceae bacterium]